MKILVIEDNQSIADSLATGLKNQNHTVDVAYDGHTGLDLAFEESYDAIILDWMLPEVSGIQILQQIRKELIQTPILMLTAKSEIDDKVLGLDSGADDYLSKPFAFKELLSRLNAITRRPTNLNHDQLICGQIKLDLQSKVVTHQDKTIQLTKTEYALLEYLLRNQDQVLTSEQITQAVWSYQDDVLTNTAQVYIGYLRNKIDKPFHTTYIKTIRGFGYKLTAEK